MSFFPLTMKASQIELYIFRRDTSLILCMYLVLLSQNRILTTLH